jgi:hypothetical protein
VGPGGCCSPCHMPSSFVLITLIEPQGASHGAHQPIKYHLTLRMGVQYALNDVAMIICQALRGGQGGGGGEGGPPTSPR